jgi:hypothetical protein
MVGSVHQLDGLTGVFCGEVVLGMHITRPQQPAAVHTYTDVNDVFAAGVAVVVENGAACAERYCKQCGHAKSATLLQYGCVFVHSNHQRMISGEMGCSACWLVGIYGVDVGLFASLEMRGTWGC